MILPTYDNLCLIDMKFYRVIPTYILNKLRDVILLPLKNFPARQLNILTFKTTDSKD
jgi:hypothetical protein